MIERDKSCQFYGSNICGYAGSEGCETCFMNNISDKNDGRQSAYDAWQITRSYIPDDVDELHTGGKCRLCRKDEPNDADCYCLVDLAHPEPEHRKGMFFGFGKKVCSEIGSMLTVPVSACSECKRRMRMKDITQIGVWLLILAVAVVLMAIPSISAALSSLSPIIPACIMVAAAILGFFAGRACGNVVEKRAEEKTYTNLFEIPQLRRMQQFGWFALQDGGNGVPRASFKKSMPRPNMMIKERETDDDSVDNSAE